MYTKRAVFYLPIVFALTILGLCLLYLPVQAEGDAPPDQPSVETQDPAADPPEEIVTEETPPSNEGVENEPLSADQVLDTTPATEEVPSQPPVADPENPDATQDATDPAPADTPVKEPENADPDLVVLDENGNEVALATQEAKEIIAAPDPYFYVGSVRYSFLSTCTGVEGICTVSTTPIQDAFNYIRDNGLSPVGGAVYIEAGVYTENINIEATGNWSNPTRIPAVLALIGAGPTARSVGSSENQTINGTIIVRNMKSFVIQAITFTATTAEHVVGFSDNTGTLTLTDVKITNTGSGTGLRVVNQNGAVNLDRVDVSDNGSGGYGASINNLRSPSAAVLIRNSNFYYNGSYGLTVSSNGAITLTGVTAGRNGGFGANLFGRSVSVSQSSFNGNGDNGLTAGLSINGGAVTVAQSQFNNNAGTGLYLPVNGNVALTGLNTSNNAGDGMYVDTCSFSVSDCLNTASGNVTISQAVATGNGHDIAHPNYGLRITAKGAITLTDVLANHNGSPSSFWLGSGAFLSNLYNTNRYAITITNGSFDDNYGSGLSILSHGQVTLRDISTSHNNTTGTSIDNRGTGIVSGVTISSTVDLVNKFTFNVGGTGLSITSNGAVTVGCVQANNNASDGLYIVNSGGTGAVSASNIITSTNSGYGVFIQSIGSITLRGVQSKISGVDGIFLENDGGTAGVGVLASSTRMDNIASNNNGMGLHIQTHGPITIQRLQANSNQGIGALLGNILMTTPVGSVTITDSAFNYNAYTSSGHYGLYLLSNGVVTAANITASGNGFDDPTDVADVVGNGAFMDNTFAAAARAITISNGVFNDNFGYGLNAVSMGAIRFTTGSSLRNDDIGVSLNNSTSITPQTVTTGQLRIENNGSYGLQIVANGAVTLAGIDSKGNRDNGVDVDTLGAITLDNVNSSENLGSAHGANLASDTGSITVRSASISLFNWNGGEGLIVMTKGAITLTNISAVGNHTIGIELDNCYMSGGVCSSTAGATLTGVNASGNIGDGISLRSGGLIRATDLGASSNNGYGAKLENSDTTRAAGVTLARSRNYRLDEGRFCDNNNIGLEINSKGAVSISYVTVTGNGDPDYGASVNNSMALTPMPVTITKSIFSENLAHTGIYVSSHGAITYTNNDASRNTGGIFTGRAGAELFNYGAPTVQNVIVGASTFNDNTPASGLIISSHGNITLTNLTANGNHAYGISATSSIGTITVNGTRNTAVSNEDIGFNLNSYGNLSALNLTAENNTKEGVYAVSTAGTITLTSLRVNRNGNSGINAIAYGAITVSSAMANGNGMGIGGGSGIYLTSNNSNISAAGCAMANNFNSGFAAIVGSVHTVTLTGSTYFGNAVSGITSDPNLYHPAGTFTLR